MPIFARNLPRLALSLALWLGMRGTGFGETRPPIDFNRDIRPILSENCFLCHGQDANKRKAKLRLDTRDGGRTSANGPLVIVPGKPDDSELVTRIFSSDPEKQMPPPDSHRALKPPQRELLKRWIAAGAPYADHWAFQPVGQPRLPDVKRPRWIRQPLDAFILARLENEGLVPAAEAPPATWLRRASFDLIGLAPTPEELATFEADAAALGEPAYAAAADRLLASPRFGERQAQEWLDIARYADTHGFNNDSTRTMWRWRDWVIDAFNNDLPYDQFLTEQLAGDLLENATLDQRIATGFGRNHVVNSEGGIIDEEYRVEYVADRVRTLGLAWLGLTLECSRCHDHKYDPLAQQDYYRLFAFFNNVAEFGEDGRIGNAAPILTAPTDEQSRRLGELDASIARATGELEHTPTPSTEQLLAALREKTEASPAPEPATPGFALSTTSKPPGRDHPQLGALIEFDGSTEVVMDVKPASFSAAAAWTLATWVRWDGGEAPVVSTMDLLVDPSAGGAGKGAEVRVNDEGEVEVRIAEFWPAYAIKVASEDRLSRGQWRHVSVSYDGSTKAAGVRLHLDGRPASLVVLRDGLAGRGASGHQPRLGRTIAKPPEIMHGAVAGLRLFTNVVDGAALAPWAEDQVARWLASDERARDGSPDLVRTLALRQSNDAFARQWAAREQRRLERLALLREAPQTMVMAERPSRRNTFILRRGRYDSPTDPVEPGVPEALLGAWPAGAPTNRLGLARWLTQPGHPLTSRVVVNRLWAQLFGAGLVRTVEDFGVQGEPPSHPELLDHLARDFMDHGWNVKRFLRELVLSATYRQDSAITPALRERDPANRLLARGPRLRLPAETLRDHALAISGLLRHRLGGPSVFPPQPETLYAGVVVAADYPGTKWLESNDDDRHRRSLYTFWKRTVPHPVMTTFDAPDRETCTARRLPTNTPLQALALMNEPAFVEAGHTLGVRALSLGGVDDRSRLNWLFRVATSRPPDSRETSALQRSLERLRAEFEKDPAGARALLPGKTAPTPETAAWAALGGLVLNLDETITRY